MNYYLMMKGQVLLMKATGIVRRIDDLGRIVIPKEIRRTMRIREGDPLEIYTSNEGEVVFKKFSPVGEISTVSSQYAEMLNKEGGLPVIICDRDHVVAAAGIPKKEILERRIAPALEDMMQTNRPISTDVSERKIRPIEGVDRYAIAGSLVTVDGDPSGCILFLSGDKTVNATEAQQKMCSLCAQVIASHLSEQ